MEKAHVNYSLTKFRDEEKGGQNETKLKEGIFRMWENWAKFSQVEVLHKALRGEQ